MRFHTKDNGYWFTEMLDRTGAIGQPDSQYGASAAAA